MSELDENEQENDWSEYETGPFCRHFSDPCDCEIRCATCGHRCTEHYVGDPGECMECDCEEWTEAEDDDG